MSKTGEKDNDVGALTFPFIFYFFIFLFAYMLLFFFLILCVGNYSRCAGERTSSSGRGASVDEKGDSRAGGIRPLNI